MTISQNAINVRARLKEGNVGDLAFNSHLTDEVTAANRDPQAVQVSTVTVGGTTGLPRDVTLGINGITVTYAAGGSDTTADIAAGLKAAVEQEPSVGNTCVPSAASNVLTLTGVTAGQSFTLDDSDTDLTAATTQAAATAAAVEFGRAIVGTGFSADGDRMGAVADEAKFTAQTATGTVTYAANTQYDIEVEFEGQTYTFSVPATTNADTTAGLLRTALTAGLPSGLTLSGATDEVIVTADVAGAAFTMGAGANIALSGSPVPTAATSMSLAFLGMSKRVYQEEVGTIGGESANYPANAGMVVVRGGNSMWVSNTQSPTNGDPVYVDLAVGSGAGLLYNTAGTDRVLLPQAKWLKAGHTSTDGIAAVAL